jgi:hypothetical protein
MNNFKLNMEQSFENENIWSIHEEGWKMNLCKNLNKMKMSQKKQKNSKK